MQQININELKPHPKFARYFCDLNGDSWKALLKSIAIHGVINPVIISQDKTILSGHQRVRACKLLGIEKVPFEIRFCDTELDELKEMVLCNIQADQNLKERCINIIQKVHVFEIFGIINGAPKKKVYVIKTDDGLKIGYTNNINRRIKELGVPVLNSYVTPECYNYSSILYSIDRSFEKFKRQKRKSTYYMCEFENVVNELNKLKYRICSS